MAFIHRFDCTFLAEALPTTEQLENVKADKEARKLEQTGEEFDHIKTERECDYLTIT